MIAMVIARPTAQDKADIPARIPLETAAPTALLDRHLKTIRMEVRRPVVLPMRETATMAGTRPILPQISLGSTVQCLTWRRRWSTLLPPDTTKCIVDSLLLAPLSRRKRLAQKPQ